LRVSRRTLIPDPDCAIAQAVDVLGDWWSLLVLRDIARGRCRFDELRTSLGVSRAVLTDRLQSLVADGVLRREAYSTHPPRDEYVLTPRGRGALPLLVALQDFGDRWLLGDGSATATATAESVEAQRVRGLIGTIVPALDSLDPVADKALTVVYCYPGTRMPAAADVPGAAGCTLESCTYRDRLAEFAALGAEVRGVSTQTPTEQAGFAAESRITFPLLSDAALELTTALRLPTFRAGGTVRIKRLTLLVSRNRTIQDVLYPIADVTGSVEDALAMVRRACESTLEGLR
jgi:DNA-binding HxlR family transcriptional regulator/peroxiredoxin